MRSLGWTRVPGGDTGLRPDGGREASLPHRDNKLGELAEWDLDLSPGSWRSLDEARLTELTGSTRR